MKLLIGAGLPRAAIEVELVRRGRAAARRRRLARAPHRGSRRALAAAAGGISRCSRVALLLRPRRLLKQCTRVSRRVRSTMPRVISTVEMEMAPCRAHRFLALALRSGRGVRGHELQQRGPRVPRSVAGWSRSFPRGRRTALRSRGRTSFGKKMFLLGEMAGAELRRRRRRASIQGSGRVSTTPINSTLDFVGTLSYIDSKVDVGPFNVSAGRLRARRGRPQRVSARTTELSMSSLKYVRLQTRAGGDTGLSANGRRYFEECDGPELRHRWHGRRRRLAPRLPRGVLSLLFQS